MIRTGIRVGGDPRLAGPSMFKKLPRLDLLGFLGNLQVAARGPKECLDIPRDLGAFGSPWGYLTVHGVP